MADTGYDPNREPLKPYVVRAKMIDGVYSQTVSCFEHPEIVYDDTPVKQVKVHGEPYEGVHGYCPVCGEGVTTYSPVNE